MDRFSWLLGGLMVMLRNFFLLQKLMFRPMNVFSYYLWLNNMFLLVFNCYYMSVLFYSSSSGGLNDFLKFCFCLGIARTPILFF
jgi:hypothetical protein